LKRALADGKIVDETNIGDRREAEKDGNKADPIEAGTKVKDSWVRLCSGEGEYQFAAVLLPQIKSRQFALATLSNAAYTVKYPTPCR
jgi:hypothetical protein